MYITNLNKSYQIPSKRPHHRNYSSEQKIHTDQSNDKHSQQFKKLMSKIFNRIYSKGYNEKHIPKQEISIPDRPEKHIINTKYKQKTFFTQYLNNQSEREYQNIRIQGRRKCQTESNLHPQRKSFKITCKTPIIVLMRNQQYKKKLSTQKYKSLSNQKMSIQAELLQKTFTRTQFLNASTKNGNKLIVQESGKKSINLPISNTYVNDDSFIKMVTLFKDRQKGNSFNDKKMNFTKQNWNKKILQKQKKNRAKFITNQHNNKEMELDEFQPWNIEYNGFTNQDVYFNLKKNF